MTSLVLNVKSCIGNKAFQLTHAFIGLHPPFWPDKPILLKLKVERTVIFKIPPLGADELEAIQLNEANVPTPSGAAAIPFVCSTRHALIKNSISLSVTLLKS
jgi:hypothetical protein